MTQCSCGTKIALHAKWCPLWAAGGSAAYKPLTAAASAQPVSAVSPPTDHQSAPPTPASSPELPGGTLASAPDGGGVSAGVPAPSETLPHSVSEGEPLSRARNSRIVNGMCDLTALFDAIAALPMTAEATRALTERLDEIDAIVFHILVPLRTFVAEEWLRQHPEPRVFAKPKLAVSARSVSTDDLLNSL